MKETVAIIVTYNRKELLIECIESIRNQENTECDILVIDNHSTDGTREYLSEYINNNFIIYIDTGENLGGAGGFNFGIKQGAILGYKYLWIMDDDCIPSNNALEVLLSADKSLKGNYGFLSSKALWKDGSICKMNVQRKTLTKNLKSYDKQLIPVVMASFVSLFVKTDIVKEIGLPIKEFFIWTDDWEYTRRISRKYISYVVADSIVFHKSNSNIPADISTDSMNRLSRYMYLYRNDICLYRREGIKGFIYEILRIPYHILKVLLKADNHKIHRISIIIKGSLQGLKFKPTIEELEKNENT